MPDKTSPNWESILAELLPTIVQILEQILTHQAAQTASQQVQAKKTAFLTHQVTTHLQYIRSQLGIK
jgi:hypothetical protein